MNECYDLNNRLLNEIRECPRSAQRLLIMLNWDGALCMKRQKSQMSKKFWVKKKKKA